MQHKEQKNTERRREVASSMIKHSRFLKAKQEYAKRKKQKRKDKETDRIRIKKEESSFINDQK